MTTLAVLLCHHNLCIVFWIRLNPAQLPNALPFSAPRNSFFSVQNRYIFHVFGKVTQFIKCCWQYISHLRSYHCFPNKHVNKRLVIYFHRLINRMYPQSLLTGKHNHCLYHCQYCFAEFPLTLKVVLNWSALYHISTYLWHMRNAKGCFAHILQLYRKITFVIYLIRLQKSTKIFVTTNYLLCFISLLDIIERFILWQFLYLFIFSDNLRATLKNCLDYP